MRPEPDFYAPSAATNLPELRLWRAVLSRAVLDVQHGSQAQARDVLKWIDTKDFERLVVWAGFELEQGRHAAQWLRQTFADRFGPRAKNGANSILIDSEPPVQDEFDTETLADEGTPHANALLVLIFTARDISRAKKISQRRASRRRLPQGSATGERSYPLDR
ncbi:MAG: hypothetical protein ABW205_03330 [Burkholderiales bacterium]|jgi:hypothetical protein